MRLIDADALMEHLKDIPTWWANGDGAWSSPQKYPDALFYPEDIISAIECAPTVEAIAQMQPDGD